MALTPDEIRAKAFPQVKKGGVDELEVAEFLDALANEVQELNEHADQALQQLALAHSETEAARLQAQDAQQQASRAESSAPRPTAGVGSRVDEVLDAAQRTADSIVSDAETYATTQRREADQYAETTRGQVDELRRTTEEQAETFREETIVYTEKLRRDAEISIEATRQQAEAQVQASYAQLIQEAIERMREVQAAEQQLLDSITRSTDDLGRARDRFASLVEEHADDEQIAPQPPTIDAPGPASDGPTLAETPDVDDFVPALETPADATWGATPTGASADESWEIDGDESTTPAPADTWAENDVAAGQSSSWADTSEGTDHTWGASDEHADAAAPEAAQAWAPTTEATPADSWAAPVAEEPADTWDTPLVTDSWSTDADTWDAPADDDKVAAWSPVGTAEAWAGAEAGGAASESVAASGDEDPLAAMVRQAVERVTEGEGQN